MKRMVCFIITVTLLVSSASIAFAKSDNAGKQHSHKVTQQHNHRIKAKKQNFKIKKSPVITYGKYKLPISPVTKGMGATVTFDKKTAVMTVVKGTNTIVFDFKNETVTVNGVVDTNCSIFTSKNNKRMTVLIKYIANVFGVSVYDDKDEVIIEVPGLDLPTNVTVMPVGTTVTSNTLNSTTYYMSATANITAGQATGGKAELYVGSRLVATDAIVAATDTAVTFTTTDNTPTKAELQTAIPKGGVVTVKLYNASNNYVISSKENPTLIVDYVRPTITSITSAIYNVAENQLYLIVTGAGSIGDMVDVTKISLYDSTLKRTYQLTEALETGSIGIVNSSKSLVINIGSLDQLGLTDFGGTTVFLTVSIGSLLTDAAGNASDGFTTTKTIPVTVIN